MSLSRFARTGVMAGLLGCTVASSMALIMVPGPRTVTSATLLAEVQENARRLSAFIAEAEKRPRVPVLTVVREQYDSSTPFLRTVPPELKLQVEALYKDLFDVAQLSLTASAMAGALNGVPVGMGKQVAPAQRQSVLARARSVSVKPVIDGLEQVRASGR